jgi:hypothetical protein
MTIHDVGEFSVKFAPLHRFGFHHQREGIAPYAALVSSSYALRAGKWKLVVHPQTPE